MFRSRLIFATNDLKVALFKKLSGFSGGQLAVLNIVSALPGTAHSLCRFMAQAPVLGTQTLEGHPVSLADRFLLV
jgi:hypothetical protein